ncbi:hypothetical protein K788_00007805 (plasmid) [Paraburkholderia caribensis MBA4]|uniref:Uncharacterized protein n=1 Tax=Paraburkholderia caribensis MBA4 TaxID=1323664 RepID=A0A0P0RN22_9BURK|nr:hypothetical protein K788_00007805 [Paraburkholderia caribensis MBA4]
MTFFRRATEMFEPSKYKKVLKALDIKHDIAPRLVKDRPVRSDLRFYLS